VGDHVFTEVAAGGSSGVHTCALDIAEAAFCWGWGVYGQRGDGTWTHGAYSPVPVIGGHTFSRIAAGRGHTCALDTSGAAYCWGLNWAGGLGNGNTTNTSAPVAVLGGHSFVQIDLGLHHTCAEDGDGALFCWGGNDFGQLGDGTTTPSLVPIQTLPF
jgi:alpha-tubulin suppressor-like RCC1 family protein